MKKRKRLLSALLTLCMLLSLVPALGITAAAAGETVHVSTGEELDTALWNHNKTDTPYTICLDSDITTNRTDIGNQQVTIDLCGRTINGTQNSNVLLVINNGAKVTVKDSKGGGKIIYTVEEYYSSSNALFSVSDGGLLTIDSGTFLITSPNATPGYVIRGGSTYGKLAVDINGGVFRNETGYTKVQRNGCLRMHSGKAEIENAAFYSPTEGLYLDTTNPRTPATATVNNCTFETGSSAIACYDGQVSVGAATFTIGKEYGYAIYINNYYLESYAADFIQDGYRAYVDGELYTKTNSVYLGTGEAGCVVEITDKTYISNPTITDLEAPTHGKAADYTASTGDPNCTVSKIRYVMFNKPLDPYVGAKGDNIGVEVTVKAAAGYSFPKVTKATWNKIESYSATVNAAGDECVYLFPYTVGATAEATVTALKMTVEAPAVGKTPASTATVNKGVRLESLSWEPADAEFKDGVSYTVTGYLWPEEGYVFDSGIVANQLGTVNGNQAVLTKPSGGGIKDQFATGIYVSYTFPKTDMDYDLIVNTYSRSSVVASMNEAVTLTVYTDLPDIATDIRYQWYRAAANVAGSGTAIPGATAASYKLPTSTEGTAYYYCVVTATVGGKSVSSESSDAPMVKVEVSAYKFPFTDVPESAWYYESIRDANKMGLINGITPTTYAPKNNMTVAEAIKLAACMHQLYHEGEVTLANAEGKWYISYYDYCRDNGIISATGTAQEPSYEDYVARAKENITRREYVFLFSRALPDSALPAVNTIPDNSIPDVPMSMSVYDQAIYKLYRAGILNGADAKGTFMPDSSIRRSEVAAILIRMMEPSARVDAPSELGK